MRHGRETNEPFFLKSLRLCDKSPLHFFLYVNAKNTSYLMSWKQRLTMQRARFAALKLHRRLFRRNNVLMWRSFSFRTPTRFWPPLTCLMAYTLAVLHCFKSIPSTFADSQQKICPGKFNLSIYLWYYIFVVVFVIVASVCQIGRSRRCKWHLAITAGTLQFY